MANNLFKHNINFTPVYVIHFYCAIKSIIIVEQGGGRKHSWGCNNQLLINKMVLDQVKKQRRNLFMMWLDYHKAFDSVPHGL